MTNIKVTTIFSDTLSRVTSIDLLAEQETCCVWCCVRKRRFTSFLTIHLQEDRCPVTVEEEVLGLLEMESVVKIKIKQGTRTLCKKIIDASYLIQVLKERHQYGEIYLTIDISQYSPLTLSLDVRVTQSDSESLTHTEEDSSVNEESDDDKQTICTISDQSDSVASHHQEVTCAPKIILPSSDSSASHHDEEYDNDGSTHSQQLEPTKEELELACSLWGRITFLTKEQLEEALDDVTLLGRGAYGEVWLATYEGETVAIKSMVQPDSTVSMLEEVRLLLDLDGAGGMPRALAVCFQVSALILEYVGHTYDKFLARCSVDGLIDSLMSIVERMKELHAKDIVHNDIKANNITFSGTVDSPVFHIIDCGFACTAGQVVDCYVPDGDEALYPWLGPEVKGREPVFPSHDVFSLGALMDVALEVLGKDVPQETATDLQRLADVCRETEPTRRPSLNMVAAALRLIKKELPSDALPVTVTQSVTDESDWAPQVLMSPTVSSTSHLEALGNSPQRLDDFSTSYPQQVVSAPMTFWTHVVHCISSHHRLTQPPSHSLDTRLQE